MRSRFFVKINRSQQQVLVTGGFLEVFKVALPLILSNSCHAANLFFDRLMLARYAQDAVGAAFAGGLTHFTISCIFIEALNEGSGLSVSTSNISWCTPDTYRNALTTAGITDANVTITAPFSVSGTAALTGIYMAYESITGKKLDETAKQVGSEELAVSSELANEIGDEDTSAIVNDLKAILDQTRNMSDEELRSTIVSIASDYDQNLTEEQIQKLINLVRNLEKLDTNALMERVNSVKDALHRLSDVQNTAQNFTEKLRSFISTIVEFFQGLVD